MANDRALTDDARELINQPDNEVNISAASVLEMAIKQSIGKLQMPPDLLEQVKMGGFTELPIDHQDCWEVGRLPLHHRDPFDRILIAQARNKGLTIVTHDRQFSAYEVSVYGV
jgi:PIN domain nuclease of toxin-antitoxin system